ncbi:S1C family serine protease [Georgenia muralis]|uniref:Putative serine protease PepD n=1 Tax=Georgenia muralis TaxID=154117 RepID=A0A3N4Z8C3_9MICO|nr:trypsin-like peptidase domain-containing protein [Georgenia muralis]RPF27450.1 putative serine protease PepD [Georgenia muralis]
MSNDERTPARPEDQSRWTAPNRENGWTAERPPAPADGAEAPFGYERAGRPWRDGQDTVNGPTTRTGAFAEGSHDDGEAAGRPHGAAPHTTTPHTTTPYAATPYGAPPYAGRPYGTPQRDGRPYGGNPPGQPYGPTHEMPAALGGNTGRPADFGRPGDSDRRGTRRPGWGALVGTAAATALVVSLGTAGITGAFDEEARPAASTSVTDSAARGEPVVTSTTDDPDWANVAAAVRPSVVAIDVRTASGEGAGSGVVLDEEGHILTNDHVVGDALDGGIVVTLADGRMYEAEISGLDDSTDLAVITLTDPPDDLAPATLGDSDEVVVGDPVVAVGNPLGLSSTVTTGIVSALDRPVTTSEQSQQPGQQGTTVVTNAIQVDAAINPGNSGGPLFDATGRVIGINSSIAAMSGAAGGSSGSIGLGFAIPVNLARQVSDQLIANGVAEHAYLGVSMSDGTASTGEVTRTGARVETVQPSTPAESAGLQVGDVITAIDGDPVGGAESLTGYIRQYASGDDVTLTVVRDGEETEVSATLATREDQL